MSDPVVLHQTRQAGQTRHFFAPAELTALPVNAVWLEIRFAGEPEESE